VAVRYFTAIIRNDPPALARQQTYLAALAVHCGSTLEIVLGRYQAKRRECRQCGAAWTAYEEKETDVNIAVSLVADAASGAADIALLVTADSDLCPGHPYRPEDFRELRQQSWHDRRFPTSSKQQRNENANPRRLHLVPR